MQTLLAIVLLTALPCAAVWLVWTISWRSRGMRPEARIARAVGLIAGIVGGPGLLAWVLTADEDGESTIAVGVSTLMVLIVVAMVVRTVATTFRRTRARRALIEGRDVEAGLAWMRAEVDRVRLSLKEPQAPQYAEVTTEDAIVLAAIGRHEDAEQLMHRAAAPAVLAIAAFEQSAAALAALRHLARGDAEKALSLLPKDADLPTIEPGRAYDLVLAVTALAASLGGAPDRAARLAADREGARPFAGALRILARAHLAAAKPDRELALRELAALRGTKFPSIVDRYAGPATALARAEGPYRG